MSNNTTNNSSAKKFGTFLGVFTPSVLTILGLIMYLRFGWVVGNVGLGFTLLIVLMASSITLITGLSASAISTNMHVGTGGEYYMISRSLGVELGGAIGIPLYLCRTLSITFYSFGLAEAIVVFLPEVYQANPYMVQILAATVIVVISLLSGKSAALVLKSQIPLLIIVGLSVVALLIGVLGGGFHAPEMKATYRTAPQGFWYVFAVFFPAVTGFTAGIGISGDLKDPQKSIPRGTIGAILTGMGIYLLIPVLLAFSAKISPEQLANSTTDAWTNVAFLGAWIVFPAIWGAILSSAFGSILGGPRVLQALAMDGLAPRFLAKLSKTGQPTIATWVSGAIALGAVLLGGLNAVAQFVTVLFLSLYVMVNFSAALEQLVGDPSYRPTLKVPWYVSLLGAAGAIAVMFLISPIACLVAVFVIAGLYLWINSRSLAKQWGDVRGGFWQVVARYALLNLKEQGEDPRNWRPRLLLFIRDASRQSELIRYASWFGQNRGIVTACRLEFADLNEQKIDTEVTLQKMESDLKKEGLVAFSEVNVVDNFENGIMHIAQANGIAGLKSNTVMFGWSEEESTRLASQLKIIRALERVGKSTIITRFNHKVDQLTPTPKIDLWWGGRQANGDLMLLLAYLLTMNDEWNKANITVRSIVNSEEEMESMAQSMKPLIPQARVKAKVEVVVKHPNQNVKELIYAHSHDADVVFMGLNIPEPGTEDAYAKRMTELSEGLKTTIFVRNSTMRSSVPVLLRL